MRCHSVFSWGCSSLSFHQVLVARERMASVRPVFFVNLFSGFFPKKPMSSTRFSYICESPFSALVIGALESERGLLPRRGSAFREGHKKSCDLNHRLAISEASVGRRFTETMSFCTSFTTR